MIKLKDTFLSFCWVPFFYIAVHTNIWYLSYYLIFVIWVKFLLFLVSSFLLINKEFRNEIQKTIPAYPYWIFGIITLTQLGILCFSGWWWMTALFFYQIIVEYYMCYHLPRLEKNYVSGDTVQP